MSISLEKTDEQKILVNSLRMHGNEPYWYTLRKGKLLSFISSTSRSPFFFHFSRRSSTACSPMAYGHAQLKNILSHFISWSEELREPGKWFPNKDKAKTKDVGKNVFA